MKRIILLVLVLFAFVNTHAAYIMIGEITFMSIKNHANIDVGMDIF